MINLLITCLFVLQAHALPKVTVEKINGFEVHFVDIGRGNTLGVSFQVPYGTLHDYGRYLGRAHLLEHLMHVGTLKYPGYHAFNELLLPAGVDTNASTGLDRTWYHAAAKDDKADLLIKVFLSMLGGLEMDPGALENERAVVINEIVEESIPQQTSAYVQMTFTQLLPPDHPWAMSLLGNGPSLKGLTRQDLFDVYNQVYRPGIVKIAVHGNFSDPAFFEKIRAMVRAEVRASPKQNGKERKELEGRDKLRPELNLATRAIPSLFSEKGTAPESEKRLYVETPNLRMGSILLEGDAADLPANTAAVSVLSSYLGNELPGGFIHKLKTELGWITEGGVWTVRVRGRQLMFFNYSLARPGIGKDKQIGEIFFQALKAAQTQGVSTTFLENEKNIVSHQLEAASRSVGGFLPVYAEILRDKKSFAEQIRDIQSVSSADVKRVALTFRPDQALYTRTGPAVPEMQHDDTYNRGFKLEDNRAELARYVEVMRQPTQITFDPSFLAVDLGERPAVSAPYFARSRPGETEKFAIDVRDSLPDAAVSLDLQLSPRTPEDMVAFDLVLDAFFERYAAQINYISAHYRVALKGGLHRTNSTRATFSAFGEDGYAARALAWQLRELAKFMPTADELNRARERYLEQRDSSYLSDFTAVLAMDRTRVLMDPLETKGLTGRKLADQVTWESMRVSWRLLRTRADRQLTAAGAFATSDLTDVRSAAMEFADGQMPVADRVRLTSRFVWSPGEVVEPFTYDKGATSYASVRSYQGPPSSDLKKVVAFRALGELIGNQIFIHNRGEQKLGYIHNASVRQASSQYYLLLFGGTKGEENAGKMADGWRHVLDRVRSGEVGDEELADAISSLRAQLGQTKTTARQLMDQYANGFTSYDDPRIHQALLAAAKDLTPADIRESARTYLTGDGTPYSQLTLHGCEDLLSP